MTRNNLSRLGNQFKRLWQSIKQLKLKKQRLSSDEYFIIAAFVIVILFLLIDFSIISRTNNQLRQLGVLPPLKIFQEPKDIARLNGVKVEEGQESPWPMAVVIENHFEAWPQSGLEDAAVVYELLVEGGITRFLAIYDLATTTDQIGPVRSARDYFIDYLEEYPAIFSHSGGSPQSLTKLRDSVVINHDEFANFQDFYRLESRWAPHNLYTDSDRLTNARDRLVASNTPEYGSWKFSDQLDHNSATSSEQLHISFTRISHTYDVDWFYDAELDLYWREQAGQPHRMTGGAQLIAHTVVVMEVPAEVIDAIGRLEMDTLGRGPAIVFRNGQAVEGEWRKLSAETRIRFFDQSGQEIPLKPGKLWFEIIRPENQYSW